VRLLVIWNVEVSHQISAEYARHTVSLAEICQHDRVVFDTLPAVQFWAE
jgi:hypothetical protein